MGEGRDGGMDYGVDKPTSFLDDSRSTTMTGAREHLANVQATRADIDNYNNQLNQLTQAQDVSDFFGGNDPSAFSTPAPVVKAPRVAFNNQPISGQGPVNTFSRYLQTFTEPVADFFRGDSSPSSSPSPSANRFQSGLASLMGGTPEYGMSPGAMGGRAERDTVPDFVRVGGGTAPLPARPQTLGAPRPSPFNINNLEAGRPGMDDLLGDPLIYAQDRPIDRRPRPDPNEIANALTVPPYDINNLEAGRPTGASGLSPGAMGGRYFPVKSGLTGVTDDPFAPPTRPGTDFFGEGPLDEATTLANLVTTGKKGNAKQEAQKKTIGQRLQELGKKISDFSFSDFIGFVGDVLRGDPNYKGPSAAQINPFTQVPGPGPYVGGGVPSPSAEMGGGAPSPIQCPPGFKFDPVMNVCVPIVAPAPTDPVTTTPEPGTTAPATGGISNIPNVYPFTLTPPIGAPVGNLPPVRS